MHTIGPYNISIYNCYTIMPGEYNVIVKVYNEEQNIFKRVSYSDGELRNTVINNTEYYLIMNLLLNKLGVL